MDEDTALSEVLRRVAEEVVLPALDRFDTRANELAVAEGDALRDAWAAAADAWQEVVVLQIGPAGSEGIVVGGQDLAEEVNSWPLTNECRIDQETAEEGYASDQFFQSEHVNVYGLDAIEYLLFAPAGETECNPMLPLVKDGVWKDLGTEEIQTRRQAFARTLAGEVARRSAEIRAAWQPDEGDWSGALMNAGKESSPYADTQTALNDVFGALFYLDLVSKDLKLAKPAGVMGCSSEVCPDAVESLWAGRSIEFLLANVKAGRALVEAFSPLLDVRGAADLGESLLTELDTTTSVLQEISGDMKTVLEADPTSIRNAHAVLKGVTDLLKGQFVTVLSLSIPDEGAGDND